MSAANQNGEDLGYVDMPPANMPTEWRLSNETFSEKFMRKFKSNPLIPIGLMATSVALSYGLWQMKTGNRDMSQKMMRLRVVAQGFTVVALVAGVAQAGYMDRQKKKLKET